jgi:hypothetical protein
LRVIDRDRELAAEHLQGILFHRPVDAAHEPRSQKHDAREMLPRKNPYGDGSFQSLHFLRHLFQFGRGADPIELIEHENFLVRFEIGNHRLIAAHS